MIVECESCHGKNRVPSERLHEHARCGRCKTELAPLDHPVHVTSADEFGELVTRSPLPVLVDFWAAWCGPCRALAPALDQVARQNRGRAIIAKVDTDALPELSARFGIRGIPTLIKFEGGREQKRASGALPARGIVETFGL